MPEPAIAVARPLPRFLTVSLARELGILLCLSVMFPFLIHVIPVPEDSRLGARLLPMFYAPLLAALWGRTGTAAVVALLAPWLNWVLTGHPAPRGAVVMMLELAGFVATLRVLLRTAGPHWFLAAPAFFAGKTLAVLVVLLVPALIGGRAALPWAAQSLVTSWPGIVILVLLNWLALRFYPPGPAGGGPRAA